MSDQKSVRFHCRHILTAGNRCGSPALRNEEFCYFHHQNRRPVENLRERRAVQATYSLPDPEDRAAIQVCIGEVIRRLTANTLDAKRAGLILYGLQIASSNLPRQRETEAAAPVPVEEITIDPTHGTLAPIAEIVKAAPQESLHGKLLREWDEMVTAEDKAEAEAEALAEAQTREPAQPQAEAQAQAKPTAISQPEVLSTPETVTVDIQAVSATNLSQPGKENGRLLTANDTPPFVDKADKEWGTQERGGHHTLGEGYFLPAFSFSRTDFKASSFWPASPSLPAAVRRW